MRSYHIKLILAVLLGLTTTEVVLQVLLTCRRLNYAPQVIAVTVYLNVVITLRFGDNVGLAISFSSHAAPFRISAGKSDTVEDEFSGTGPTLGREPTIRRTS